MYLFLFCWWLINFIYKYSGKLMFKKTIPSLIMVLLLFNMLNAEDIRNIPISDSTFSKINAHIGIGVVNGLKLGVGYRPLKSFSVNFDIGNHILSILTLTSTIPIYNLDLNYHTANKGGDIFSLSLTIWDGDLNYLLITPNIGYQFYSRKLPTCTNKRWYRVRDVLGR